MSYKSDLQQNNTDLQAILADVNALPDAGSGGGGAIETCTVKINSQGSTFKLYGTNENGAFEASSTINEQGSHTFVGSVLKGSLLSIYQTSLDFNITGDATLLVKAPFPVQFFDITGDCTLSG